LIFELSQEIGRQPRVPTRLSLMIVSSRHFPDEVQGDLILCNAIGFLGIALAFTRSPFVLALEALDLDELSGGRMVVGLGAGVRRLNERWHAVAAYDRIGGRCLSVDFGTSINVDAVSVEGEYLGGVIAPGLEVSMEALSSRAAKLPRIQLEEPETAIGRNTLDNLEPDQRGGDVVGAIGRKAAPDAIRFNPDQPRGKADPCQD